MTHQFHFMGIYAKAFESRVSDICTFIFMPKLFTVAKTWKQSNCPSVDRWIGKIWYIHIIKYYSALKSNEMLQCVTTWTNLEHIMLSQIC